MFQSILVGADASVRPAVCTCKHEYTDVNKYTVCRGRCPHRPARSTFVFTMRCGKPAIAPRADRVVRPYRTFYVFAENACNSAIASCRGERGIDPYKHGTDSPECIRVCGCVPPGGQRRPPLRVRVYLLPIPPHPDKTRPRPVGRGRLSAIFSYSAFSALIAACAAARRAMGTRNGLHET